MKGIILTPMFNGLSRFHRHFLSYLILSLASPLMCIIYISFLNCISHFHLFHICYTFHLYVSPLFYNLMEALQASLPFLHTGISLVFYLHFHFVIHMHWHHICHLPFLMPRSFDMTTTCTCSIYKVQCSTREPQSGSLQ